ncbi:hypothetical protein P2T68_17060 [Pseudomonas sp. G11]|uniref:hypothetical protein n=1 Tax=Pseudomonas sp. G11 TaxID=528343 RepID=UPI00240288C4|nr:hypothetical protein [Pseudomonas sp. G11]WEX18955.1 hypothetical protein P2T68_17060 [Pseudomonas sp. G11]
MSVKLSELVDSTLRLHKMVEAHGIPRDARLAVIDRQAKKCDPLPGLIVAFAKLDSMLDEDGTFTRRDIFEFLGDAIEAARGNLV